MRLSRRWNPKFNILRYLYTNIIYKQKVEKIRSINKTNSNGSKSERNNN
jgi:hypothetical protein